MDRRRYPHHLINAVKILCKSTAVVLDLNGRLSGDIPIIYVMLNKDKVGERQCTRVLPFAYLSADIVRDSALHLD